MISSLRNHCSSISSPSSSEEDTPRQRRAPQQHRLGPGREASATSWSPRVRDRDEVVCSQVGGRYFSRALSTELFVSCKIVAYLVRAMPLFG